MASKNLKGVEQLKRRMNAVLTKTIPQKAEKAVFVAITTGGAIARTHVPVENNILAPSEYRKVQSSGTTYIGMVGYTAEYAAAVHEAKGTLKGKPRPSGRGNYWEPDAKPKFLSSAFDDNRQDIDNVVYEAMKI